jgi:hypothetical protein
MVTRGMSCLVSKQVEFRRRARGGPRFRNLTVEEAEAAPSVSSGQRRYGARLEGGWPMGRAKGFDLLSGGIPGGSRRRLADPEIIGFSTA